MNVVARQGFKYSLIGYFGFLFGTISNIFIFPNDLKFYGTLRFILSTAEIMLPVVVFGLSFSNVKFFHQAQKAGKHQNILSLSLITMVFNSIIFVGLFFLYFWIFPDQKESLIWKMKHLYLPLIPILALSAVLNKYISNYKRIAIPNIFENLFPKIANLGTFSLFLFAGWSEGWSFSFFYLIFILSLSGYFIYANHLEKIIPDFSLDYLKKDRLWHSVFNYSLFSFLGNIGNYIAFRIDSVMIGQNISMMENGIYNTFLNILSILTVSQMGVFNISAPIINKSIEERDYPELNQLYKKTSLSLFCLGAVLFSCIIVGFPYLIHFIPNGMKLLSAQPIVWILGTAVLFDLATGFNGHIISLSKYYRFNIIIMLFLAVATIILNHLFLNYTSMGIKGVALATAISLTLFNLIKIIFNYRKFGVSPFTVKMLYVVVICLSAIVIIRMLPEFHHPIVNLVYQPMLVLVFALVGNYLFKIYNLPKTFIGRFFRKKSDF